MTADEPAVADDVTALTEAATAAYIADLRAAALAEVADVWDVADDTAGSVADVLAKHPDWGRDPFTTEWYCTGEDCEWVIPARASLIVSTAHRAHVAAAVEAHYAPILAAARAEGYEAGRADAGRDALNAAADAYAAECAVKPRGWSMSWSRACEWLRARAEAVGDDHA